MGSALAYSAVALFLWCAFLSEGFSIARSFVAALLRPLTVLVIVASALFETARRQVSR